MMVIKASKMIFFLRTFQAPWSHISPLVLCPPISRTRVAHAQLAVIVVAAGPCVPRRRHRHRVTAAAGHHDDVRSRKHRLRHPRQLPPRLHVAEAQPPVKARAAGVDRPVLCHHRQVAPAGSGQADALVGKQLRPSRARRLLLVQHGAESEMAVSAVAARKELAVLGHSDGEVHSARRHRPRPDAWDAVFADAQSPSAEHSLRLLSFHGGQRAPDSEWSRDDKWIERRRFERKEPLQPFPFLARRRAEANTLPHRDRGRRAPRMGRR